MNIFYSLISDLVLWFTSVALEHPCVQSKEKKKELTLRGEKDFNEILYQTNQNEHRLKKIHISTFYSFITFAFFFPLLFLMAP